MHSVGASQNIACKSALTVLYRIRKFSALLRRFTDFGSPELFDDLVR